MARLGGSPEAGIAIMVLAMVLVPVNDALSKLLTDVLAPAEIAFWRLLFQTAALGLVVGVLRRRVVVGHWRLLALGGLCSAAVLVSIISALAVMPIATAIAIFFVEPLILTVLSAVILREPTGWRRYAAVAVGLVGALIVIRPNWALYGWVTLLPLVTAFAFAGSAVVMRTLSRDLPSLVIQFWFALFATLLVLIGLLARGGLALAGPAGIDGSGPWAQLIGMGVFSAFTFFLISEAFRRAPAGTLAPFQYLEIVGATLLGLLVFGDFPDVWTWVGTGIILLSGLYVFARERAQAGEIP